MLAGIKKVISKIYIAVFYRNDTTLLTLPGKTDRDWFIIQALMGTVFAALTGAVYLTGLLNHVNAPEILIAYVPILGSVAGMVAIFAGYSMQRIRSRKRFTLIANTVYKSALVLIAWIPLIYPCPNASYIMVGLALIAYAINNFMGIAINSWFVDLIDVKIRGRYMSVRNMVALIASLSVPIVISPLIDAASDQYKALLAVFTIAWIFMWSESYSFYRINEPEMAEPSKKIKITDVVTVPLRNKRFMKFMLMMSVFYFIWYLSMSYTTLYQMNYLDLSYTFIALTSVLNVLMQFIWYPIIGKVIDRYNWDLLLYICFTFYIFETLIWTFTNISGRFFMVPIAAISSSINAPFYSLTLFNKRYAIIPKRERPIYDGFYTALIAIIIAVAPLVGGLIKNYIQENIQPFGVFEIPQFQMLFMISSLSLVVLVLVNIKKYIYLLKNNVENETE